MSLVFLKIKTSFLAIIRMYRRFYGFILLTLILWFIIFGLLLWLFNLGLLGYVLFQSPLSLHEKFGFILGVYTSVFSNFDVPQALALFLFSVLFSVNLTILVFIFYARGKVIKESKKTGLSLMLAIIASGCAACGTSILTPLLISIGAGGSLALSRQIGIAISYLSLLLVLYSIYSLGAALAGTLAIMPQKSDKK